MDGFIVMKMQSRMGAYRFEQVGQMQMAAASPLKGG